MALCGVMASIGGLHHTAGGLEVAMRHGTRHGSDEKVRAVYAQWGMVSILGLQPAPAEGIRRTAARHLGSGPLPRHIADTTDVPFS